MIDHLVIIIQYNNNRIIRKEKMIYIIYCNLKNPNFRMYIVIKLSYKYMFTAKAKITY